MESGPRVCDPACKAFTRSGPPPYALKLENTKPFIVGNVYRHPSSGIVTFKENLLNVLDLINNKKKCYTICGDININLFTRD